MIKLLTRLAAFTGLFICLPALLPSCTHDPIGIESMDTVCFDSQILPILQSSCGMTGCHDGTEDDFSAADYESVMQSVVPGKPRSSKLYTVLIDIHGDDFMPPDQPLTKNQRMLIEIWIAQGALHTTCPADTNGSGGIIDSVCFTQDILPMMVSSCGTIGCHDVTTHAEDYILVDYATITSKGIVPFDPDESELFESVIKTGEDRMPPPPFSPFTTAQIASLRKWISDGALNSDCPEAACDTIENISYADQIVAVLQANCIGCHNSIVANGNVNLTTYDHVKTYATTIRNNEPLLTAVVRKLPGFVQMPPTFSLDECSIRKMELWIAQGTLNN